MNDPEEGDDEGLAEHAGPGAQPVGVWLTIQRMP